VTDNAVFVSGCSEAIKCLELILGLQVQFGTRKMALYSYFLCWFVIDFLSIRSAVNQFIFNASLSALYVLR